jgi:threonine/homoserine efflux transporter RhtA
MVVKRLLGAQRVTMLVSCVPVLGLVFGRLIVGDGVTLLESVAIALISAGALYGALIHKSPSPAPSPAPAIATGSSHVPATASVKQIL